MGDRPVRPASTAIIDGQRSTRIAAAAAHFGRDLDRSVARIEMIIDSARKVGTELLVLPDAALGGYLSDLHAPAADQLPPTVLADSVQIRRIASHAHDMVVCFGYAERVGRQRFNAAVCVSGDGVLGRYRKVHLPPGEALVNSAGAEFKAFDTPVGRLGMLIDYDKTFPEAARSLALDGARIVCCLSAWPANVTQQAARLTQDRQSRLFDLYDGARAAENQIVWVSSNQTGTTGGLRFLGQAKVVGPGGEVLARTWAKAGLAVADVAVETEVQRSRLVQHHLRERRPELYRTEPATVLAAVPAEVLSINGPAVRVAATATSR